MMKTLTQVILPIGAVLGVVFIITYIGNYTEPIVRSKTGPGQETNSSGKSKAGDLPMVFVRRVAEPDDKDPALKNWQSNYELGSEGQFDFWFRNPNPEAVALTPRGKTCTCTSVDLGTFPAAVIEKYLQTSFLAVLPGLPNINPLQAIAGIEMSKGVTWEPMVVEGGGDKTFIIPPAYAPGLPLIGMIRTIFKAKAPAEPKRLNVTLSATLPNQLPNITNLEVRMSVVSSIHAFVPGTKKNEVDLGEMSTNSISERDIYFWTITRPELDISLSIANDKLPKGLLTMTKPEPVPEDQLEELSRQIAAGAEAKEGGPKIRSAVKSRIILKERLSEKEKLDLGPFEAMMDVELRGSREPVAAKVPLKSIVRGDFRMLGGEKDQDKIDLGSFDVRQRKLKVIEVIAELPGLELDTKPLQVTPDFLLVSVEPIAGEKQRWRVKLEVPAGKLLGSIPKDSCLILQSKDGNRRIRIPIVGSTADSGSNPF
jgi:hypothetical protein